MSQRHRSIEVIDHRMPSQLWLLRCRGDWQCGPHRDRWLGLLLWSHEVSLSHKCVTSKKARGPKQSRVGLQGLGHKDHNPPGAPPAT